MRLVIINDKSHCVRTPTHVTQPCQQKISFNTLPLSQGPTSIPALNAFHSLKWPTVEKFDGTFDPNAHVKAYFTQASLLTRDLRIQCRLFPTTLKGEALEWYYSLPANSINSFDTFCARFAARFTDNKLAVIDSTSVQHIVQGQYMT